MGKVTTNKYQIALGIGGYMRTDMTDTGVGLYINQLNFWVVMPKESIAQARLKQLKGFARLKVNLL